MKKAWLISFYLLIVFSCKNEHTESTNSLSLIPEDTAFLIKINSPEGLSNGLKNNRLMTSLGNYGYAERLEQLLQPLEGIYKTESLIALSEDKNDSIIVSLIIPGAKKQWLDSIPTISIDSTFKHKQPIQKLQYDKTAFYSVLVKGCMFVSNRMESTLNALNEQPVNQELKTILNTSDIDKMTSVLINHKNAKTRPIIFKDSILNSLQFSNYTLLDSDISQNTITANGITMATDSTKSLINVFKTTIPQENRIAEILPANISGFKSITFDNYNSFRNNLIKHQLLDDDSQNDIGLFQNVVEVGAVDHLKQQAMILRSLDASATLDLFDLEFHDSYRGVDVYKLENPTPIGNAFQPLIAIDSPKYLITLEDFFVFSNDLSLLETIISDYQNGKVLAHYEPYLDIKAHLSDESSLLIYSDPETLNQLVNLNFADDKKLKISAYKSSALQFVYDTDFAHVNAIFKTHKTQGSNNKVSEELNISLDKTLIFGPQTVINHTNNSKDLVVQDIDNNIYLLSNNGKVFWKKQLNGKIIGDVKQIDTYKNGRLQLVFNTSNHLYVLDRNGNDVNAFPLKFNSAITQPVSVFDYDNNKNYRLMVVQGKSVHMYDKNGKTVSGFLYKSAQNAITSQPKHFRIGTKDYIVFAHGNQLEVLDRVGRQRVKVKENISFSGNEVYLYQNKFTTSNTNGELLEVDTRGHVNHKNLNANSTHKIATTSKTLVVMNDNKLTIKSKSIALDFGDYTDPIIYYINDKIYVTITDKQAKKGYVFDSQAKPIANFPIYASALLELANIDKDQALEVITKGVDDTIIIYEF